MDKDKRNLLVGLGWEVEIVKLVDPHTLFNPSPERRVNGAKQFCEDYEIIPFS